MGIEPTNLCFMSAMLYRLSYSDIIDCVANYNTKPHKKQNASLQKHFVILVAGPGYAPGSGGYEPPELLLLHPAT